MIDLISLNLFNNVLTVLKNDKFSKSIDSKQSICFFLPKNREF